MHKLLLPLLLAAALPMPALSQSLTLAMALDLVSKNNPDIAAAAAEARAHDGALRQAGVIPNPEIAAMVEDRDKASRTTTVQLNQLVELGGKRAGRSLAAGRNREAALADLAIRRAETRASAVVAFYELLAAQERHRYALASVELAKSTSGATAKRVIAGKVSPVEETKARVAESGARIDLMQAVAELAGARRRLAALWGAGDAQLDGALGRIDVLPALPPMNALEQDLPQAPGLLRAQLEVERRGAMAQLERARRNPDLTLSVGTKRDEQLGRNQAIFGLSLPLPLFDRNQGNLQEALVRTDQARDAQATTRIRLAGELAQAHAQLDAARQQAEMVRQDILPGAQSAYDAAAKGFEFGKFSFLDVLDAQRTLLQARSQHLRVLTEAHRAAADIERILGVAWAEKSALHTTVTP
jgi:cobalt-zinc-cadmium efflux system outer membrane protein